MRRILIIFSLLGYLVFGAPTKVVILADENYPPYTYVEKGKLKGIYIDLLNAVDEKLKDFEIILKPTPWVRALKMMETGQAYAIIDAWYRPVERPYMSYSIPMLKEEIVIVSLDGKPKEWPSDFNSKKIGINRGFAVFKKEDKDSIVIEEANSTEENILKLIKNRIDYYANDRYSIFWKVNNLVNNQTILAGEATKIKVVNVLSQEFGFIGYRKASTWSKRTIFEDSVNREIERIQKNGELDKIIKRYTN